MKELRKKGLNLTWQHSPAVNTQLQLQPLKLNMPREREGFLPLLFTCQGITARWKSVTCFIVSTLLFPLLLFSFMCPSLSWLSSIPICSQLYHYVHLHCLPPSMMMNYWRCPFTSFCSSLSFFYSTFTDLFFTTSLTSFAIHTINTLAVDTIQAGIWANG